MIVRTLISTSTSLSFDLQNLISEYSENSYEVQATANGYIDSDYSNIVVYTKLTSFNVFIYDNAEIRERHLRMCGRLLMVRVNRLKCI